MLPENTRSRLDHAGVIVRDLATTARTWESLGFSLSPVSRQSGRMPGRDETSPWATANRCAILRQGYLELIGVIDATAYNPWESFLRRREGMHILALRVDKADDTWAALAADSSLAADFNAPVQRERALDVDGQQQTMRFRNIFSKDERCPEARLILIEHQTPEYLWQPRYLDHPNGAQALTGVFLCCELSGRDRPGHPLNRLQALTGATIEDQQVDSVRLRSADGCQFHALSPGGFALRFGVAPLACPAYGGATVRFADRSRAASLMEANGHRVVRDGDEWFVNPAGAPGFLLTLEQAA